MRTVVLRKMGGVLHGCWLNTKQRGSIALRRPTLYSALGVFVAVLLPLFALAATSEDKPAPKSAEPPVPKPAKLERK